VVTERERTCEERCPDVKGEPGTFHKLQLRSLTLMPGDYRRWGLGGRGIPDTPKGTIDLGRTPAHLACSSAAETNS